MIMQLLFEQLTSQRKLVVVLQTDTAMARGKTTSKSIPIRILFDEGCQCSYVTKDLKDRLGLISKRVQTLNICTFGDKLYSKQMCDMVEFELFKDNGEAVNSSALTFQKICSTFTIESRSQ